MDGYYRCRTSYRRQPLVFENSSITSFYKFNTDDNWNPISGDWLTGTSLQQAETDFGQDFNSDGITGQLEDANNDGFVDGQTNYFLFNDGEAIALTRANGNTVSDSTTSNWNALAAAQNSSGFQVLLDGAASREGQYYVWNTNTLGVITSGSGWKTSEQATQLGWEETFNSDLNGDGNISKTNNKINSILNETINANVNNYLSDDLFTHQELKSLSWMCKWGSHRNEQLTCRQLG